MIVGIGVDTVEIDRVTRACRREHFLTKVFTEKEIAQMDCKGRRAASDFAGKEAVSKVLGTGFQGIEAGEIEVLRDDRGAPFVQLYGKAKSKAEQLHISKLMISITNTKELATAFVIGIREGSNEDEVSLFE